MARTEETDVISFKEFSKQKVVWDKGELIVKKRETFSLVQPMPSPEDDKYLEKFILDKLEFDSQLNILLPPRKSKKSG